MNKRLVNFEFLRIFAMVLIVFSHYSVHGLWNNLYIFDFNRFYIQFLRIGGGIGNILFFMITGYFLCKKDDILILKNVKKIIYVFLKTTIYSIILLIITLIFFKSITNYSSVFRSFFPILFQLNWFASVYIFLIIFSPFINRLFYSLNKNEAKILILVLFFSMAGISLTGQNIVYDNLRWSFLWYLVGGYIKIYELDFNNISKLLWGGNFALLIISILGVLYLSYKFPDYGGKIYSFYYEMQRFSISILAVNIFLIFLNINIKESKWIFWISQSCFGIYLLHDNIFTRDIIWKKILFINNIENSFLLIPYSILCSIGVFVISLIIDKFLVILFEKFINNISLICLKKINAYFMKGVKQ